MKKLLLLIPILAIFTACSKEQANQELIVSNQETKLCYLGDYDLTVTIKTKNNFKTITMQDNSDRIFHLNNIGDDKFINQNGVSFQKKSKKKAFAQFVPGNIIELKEVKCK